MPVWTDPGWRSEADSWIRGELERLGLVIAGELDQIHVRDWSTVIRVPTSSGDLYFKASAPSGRYEAALVTHLSGRRPDCVPPFLAADLGRGFMLAADGGRTLRSVIAEERALGRWRDVLTLYSGLQVDLMEDADELVSLGVPDLRLVRLPALFETMLAELELPPGEHDRLVASAPQVREMCDELAAFDVPESIQHDDLHDGQVFVADGRYLLLDWGDACVTHPFFTMAVTLDGVIAWGVDDIEGSTETAPYRDAYLAGFARFGERSDLVAACGIARRLGWACRAVNSHVAGEDEPERVGARLRMFLDGKP